MEEPDHVLSGALTSVAAELGAREPASLGRPALREELAAALRARVGLLSTAVAVDYVRPQGWSESSVPVDVTVRGRIAGTQSMVCACAWLDDLSALASVVPTLLAAACISRDRGSYAYLVVAAPQEIHAPGSVLDLLSDAEVATLRAIVEDLPASHNVTATVPGRLRSLPVAESWLTVGDEPWFLRASRIEPAGGDADAAF